MYSFSMVTEQTVTVLNNQNQLYFISFSFASISSLIYPLHLHVPWLVFTDSRFQVQLSSKNLPILSLQLPKLHVPTAKDLLDSYMQVSHGQCKLKPSTNKRIICSPSPAFSFICVLSLYSRHSGFQARNLNFFRFPLSFTLILNQILPIFLSKFFSNVAYFFHS